MRVCGARAATPFNFPILPGNPTPIIIASFFGLDNGIYQLLDNNTMKINYKDSKYDRTAFSFAA